MIDSIGPIILIGMGFCVFMIFFLHAWRDGRGQRKV